MTNITTAFILSKLFWGLSKPSVLLTLALGIATLLAHGRRPKLGLRAVTVVTACFFVVSIVPVGYLLARPLEERFPPPAPLPTHVDGIIVLGGATDPFMTAERGLPALNQYGERMTAFAALARAHPKARLVFTGGNGSLGQPVMSEAEVARLVFADMGLNTSRILFEDESRNTYENALFSKRLVAPAKGETWLLVTSAIHMPRSMGVFRHAGWTNLVPRPVAYTTAHHIGPIGAFDPQPKLAELDLAVHEWIGLVAYRLMGWTDTLYPGPTAAN
jgi:uncharacterized SAM-binding protein YcdF (DUF218 family)